GGQDDPPFVAFGDVEHANGDTRGYTLIHVHYDRLVFRMLRHFILQYTFEVQRIDLGVVHAEILVGIDPHGHAWFLLCLVRTFGKVHRQCVRAHQRAYDHEEDQQQEHEVRHGAHAEAGI